MRTKNTARKLLFDTSSLIQALKLKRLELLQGNYIQWLTIYEVLNGLWKEASCVKILSHEEAITIAQVFAEIVKYMHILEPRNLEVDILKIALERKLTAYDASYVALAKKYNFLVTEDNELRNKACEIISVKSLSELISQ